MTDAQQAPIEVYQLRVYLREISPLIWRRLLVHSDSTIADLHPTLQISMSWTDFHLHQFVIRGKRYRVSRLGCTGFRDDPKQVRLGDFHCRLKERSLYEYYFGGLWQHEIRLEQVLPLGPKHLYPRCIGSAGKAPPEDCGGPLAFLALKQHYSVCIAEQLVEMLETGEIEDRYEELFTFRYWWDVERFDRRAVNRRLKQYALGDEEWRWTWRRDQDESESAGHH
jgi:hypothetical protein